jgi:tetraacyldisaccharide 4'-kinase
MAGAYGGVVSLRAAWYRTGLARVRRLPLPAVGVGNLSVGGTGKTPLVAWIARQYVRAGRRPGILLRGYGHDEVLLHRRHVPEAVVIANPDRVAGALAAQAAGADILVLDDAFQVLEVERDLNIAVLSVEQEQLSPWLLPAGPWRESERALRRADLLVVTRRRVAADAAARLSDRLALRWRAPVAGARLAVSSLVGMRDGDRFPLSRLRGEQVRAAAAIADPESLAVQLRAAGATVRLAAYRDHHEYDAADVSHLVQAARAPGYLVVTEKDAVKLRDLWPAEEPEPLVAVLEWTWERNEAAVVHALNRVLGARGSAAAALTDTRT